MVPFDGQSRVVACRAGRPGQAKTGCIFCKIIAKELPAAVIDENDHVLVIKDIAPKAPVHYLIIIKKHIPDIQSLDPADAHLWSEVVLMAQKLAQDLKGSSAFRLVSNNGHQAGQCVFHQHVHFLAGGSALVEF